MNPRRNRLEHMFRNEFFIANTKPGTPLGCLTPIGGTTCLERNSLPKYQCEACREHDRVLKLWNASQQGGVQ